MTDMQTSLPLLIVQPSILNPVINLSTHLWPVKWNAWVIPLPCAFHSISSNVNATHAPTWSTIIWSTSYLHWSYWFIDLDSLALHRCFGPSAPSHHSTCPSHLQPVHRAKSFLMFSTLVTWLHVMSHMQWAPSSHVWALQRIQAISPSWHRLLTHDLPVD